MVGSIKRIDTASIRSFVTHHQTMTSARAPIAYDMMNTAQVSSVMASLDTASKLATRQATETIHSYHARRRDFSNTTQRRLLALNHSSVSQDISALLKWNDNVPVVKSWVVERKQGNFEVGVRELARMGAFGRDKASSSRLMELAL